MPLLTVDTRRGCCRFVVATDASDAGYGVCETESAQEEAA